MDRYTVEFRTAIEDWMDALIKVIASDDVRERIADVSCAFEEERRYGNRYLQIAREIDNISMRIKNVRRKAINKNHYKLTIHRAKGKRPEPRFVFK